MKKIIEKISILSFVVLLCIGGYFTYQYIQYKNKEIDELSRQIQAQDTADLEEELLDEQIENAKNYITNIDNEVSLTVLNCSGKITLTHDKTPSNNAWTEWLFNSDIKVYANYNTFFAIETSNIQTSILPDSTITITYDTDDIIVSAIDITNFTTSANTSIFGSAYTPSQVAAFEQIAREKILEKVDTPTLKAYAKTNLEDYFKTLANDFNVEIQVTSY